MSLKESFQRDGFVILENAVDPTELENTISRLAEKLLEEKDYVPSISTLLNMRELALNNRPEFFKLCSNIGGTLSALQMLSSEKVMQALLEIVGPEALDLFMMPFSLFFNDSGSERLNYDFHQESPAFPTVKQTLHIWTPLFKDLTIEDGPMVMCKGSHVNGQLPYTAFEKKDAITQLFIERELFENYEKVHCTFKRGTVVIFDKNLVHASGTNLSGIPRVAAAARFLDLKSEAEFQPYVHYYFSDEKSRKAVKGE